jgi:hypothetical protein
MSKHELETDWPFLKIRLYRGCLVSKVGDKYSIFGKTYDTPEEIDLVIDGAGEHIKTSLTVDNSNDSFTVSNTEEV